MNHAPTIHYPYADISGVVSIWAKSCQAMAVFEHGPDEGQASLHCHFYMLNCSIGVEGLKKQFHSNFLTTKTRNELWAWSHKEFPVIEALDTSGGLQYLKYMTKGVLAPKYLKNISLAKVEEAKALWVTKSPDQWLESPDKKSEWETILHYLMKKYADRDIPAVQQYKNDICYMYLSKRKPVPRMGDLTRYAYSAYMIMKSDRSSKKEVTLMSDISDFIISYESGNIK